MSPGGYYHSALTSHNTTTGGDAGGAVARESGVFLLLPGETAAATGTAAVTAAVAAEDPYSSMISNAEPFMGGRHGNQQRRTSPSIDVRRSYSVRLGLDRERPKPLTHSMRTALTPRVVLREACASSRRRRHHHASARSCCSPGPRPGRRPTPRGASRPWMRSARPPVPPPATCRPSPRTRAVTVATSRAMG